ELRRTQSAVRISQIHEVKGVRHFRAELKIGPLFNSEIPEDGNVDILRPRSIQNVASGIAVGAQRTRDKCRGVEPLVDNHAAAAVWIELNVTDNVRSIITIAVKIPVRTGSDCKGSSTLQG